ncbi:MAG: hypothetical protein NWE89_09155 [Candidatus Bathyarchaeota archaeon]|nr:hypothetical protein [Candidatus Bathyarchaeota archaeon]
MFSEKSKTVLLILLSLSLLLAGSSYLVFLHSMFPKLVPIHGGGEGFTLSEANNYSDQMPWYAYSRLHLSLQANDTIELYRDGDYVCECVQYELVLERGDGIMLMMKSSSPVEGRFTARQEIPLEKQLYALIILSAGLIGVALSIRMWKKRPTP